MYLIAVSQYIDMNWRKTNEIKTTYKISIPCVIMDSGSGINNTGSYNTTRIEVVYINFIANSGCSLFCSLLSNVT